LDAVAVEQQHAGIVDGRDLGRVEARQPHLTFHRLELGDLSGRLRRKECWSGCRYRHGGNQRSDKDLSPIDMPAGAVGLTFENIQVACTSFNAILVAWHGDNFARYRPKVGTGMDQELGGV
jgi:hypothetical protein